MRESMDNVNRRDDVLELVHAVMHQVRARQHQELRAGAELTPLEWRVLRFFGRQPGATQSDLAAHSGRDKAQLARLVKGLRERGLLEMVEDEADRRHVCVSLSAQGDALYRQVKLLDRRMTAQAVTGLDTQDTRLMSDLLERVRDNLRA